MLVVIGLILLGNKMLDCNKQIRTQVLLSSCMNKNPFVICRTTNDGSLMVYCLLVHRGGFPRLPWRMRCLIMMGIVWVVDVS